MSNNNTPAMPSRDSVTQYQVASLLGVIKQLENLAMFRPDEEDFSSTAGRNLDGGTYDAVTTTIINACATLDTILLDANRWKIELHDELYQSMLRTQSAAVASLKAQEETFKSAGTPAALFKPTLMVNGSEEFIAYWGRLESGDAITGRGKTPAAALADFNLAFLRTPKEMLDQITDIVAEANFKPKKRKKPDES